MNPRSPDHGCVLCDGLGYKYNHEFPPRKAQTMNTTPLTGTHRTIIIDSITGEVITSVPVYAAVGQDSFHAAEAIGHRFTNGKVYLHIAVNSHGRPIDTNGPTTWRFIAPRKSTAESVTVA